MKSRNDNLKSNYFLSFLRFFIAKRKPKKDEKIKSQASKIAAFKFFYPEGKLEFEFLIFTRKTFPLLIPIADCEQREAFLSLTQ